MIDFVALLSYVCCFFSHLHRWFVEIGRLSWMSIHDLALTWLFCSGLFFMRLSTSRWREQSKKIIRMNMNRIISKMFFSTYLIEQQVLPCVLLIVLWRLFFKWLTSIIPTDSDVSIVQNCLLNSSNNRYSSWWQLFSNGVKNRVEDYIQLNDDSKVLLVFGHSAHNSLIYTYNNVENWTHRYIDLRRDFASLILIIGSMNRLAWCKFLFDAQKNRHVDWHR